MRMKITLSCYKKSSTPLNRAYSSAIIHMNYKKETSLKVGLFFALNRVLLLYIRILIPLWFNQHQINLLG